MYKTNFDFVVEKAKASGKKIRVAIAGADNENILLGAFQAEAAGFAQLLLVGDEAKITTMLKNLSLYDRNYTIVNEPDYEVVVQKSIDLVKMGMADVLMRGNTQTRDFLMPILNKANHLIRKDALVTHVVLLKVPGYERLLAVSDVTLLINPTEDHRELVVKNMARTLHAFGIAKPNIALLAMVEKPSYHMRDTVEDQNMVRKHSHKPIAECNLAGPIAYDLIISKEAARLKNYDCPYCGEFDGIVVPNLMSGNLLVKVLEHNAGAVGCGVLAGARIPVAIASRSDNADKTYLSLAACGAMIVDGDVEK